MLPCARVVGPFAGQEPLPLLREVLDLLHDLAARHRFAFLSRIAAGTGLPFERGEDRARLPAAMLRCRACSPPVQEPSARLIAIRNARPRIGRPPLASSLRSRKC